MEIIYANDKVENTCASIKAAKKFFGGNQKLAVSFLARINAIREAEVIKDIILTPTFHFHNLKGKMDGMFAIDVKTRSDKWRIILQPLDDNKKPYDPCNIDEIATVVRIVEIKEVSAHYE